MARVELLGIRHHGPGSARSLLAALESIRPDRILIEGPVEASPLIPVVADAGLAPPVAILAYDSDRPERSAFYPFATFSPEWQAMRFAVARSIPVEFMDLPLTQALATRDALAEAELAALAAADGDDDADDAPDDDASADHDDASADHDLLLTDDALRQDPIGTLGRAIGEDGERWWDRFIEHRRDPTEIFEAIAVLMGELREGVAPTRFDALREAAMRIAIRRAEAADPSVIAVVCGAYHVPALLDRADADADRQELDGLPKAAVETTWVPWSERHLAMGSGYGAGVASPGWYAHLWDGPRPLVEAWLVRVARLLRDDGFDISPAHLIEASRLAESTAAIRGRSVPGLDEVNEAIRAVLTFGSDVPLALITERLIIGTGLGAVPGSVDTAPLSRDLAAHQRRLRLAPATVPATLELDLRREIDIQRSRLLHRLLVLDVPWGIPASVTARAMGTFREAWQLAWDPMFAVALVTQSRWGNTIEAAASARLLDATDHLHDLAGLATALERSLFADLPDATAGLTARIAAMAAVAADVAALLGALPPLARALRYGSVRDHDAAALTSVIRAMLQRAAIGLPGAVRSLDDAGAAEMVEHIEEGADAVGIIDDPAAHDVWADALRAIVDLSGVHGHIAGRAGRLLLDGRRMEPEEAATRLAAGLSRGATPEYTIGYLDGFLAGSGMLLVHDTRLFALVDDWLTTQTDDGFTSTLPYLRRTFGRFTAAERRALRDRSRARSEAPPPSGEPAAGPAAGDASPTPAADLDILDSLLGLGGDDR